MLDRGLNAESEALQCMIELRERCCFFSEKKKRILSDHILRVGRKGSSSISMYGSMGLLTSGASFIGGSAWCREELLYVELMS